LRKIIHIVGNRPQFVKLAVLFNQLATDKNIVQEIIHTGQHFSYSMSELFFEELNIPAPIHNFNIQDSSANLFLGKATDALETYFATQKKAVVFVYGDTNTTLAAAIAAKRIGLPLIHFEAGVRTNDNSMPEEINRILTDRLADVNYCCTKNNFETMIAEGYNEKVIKSFSLHTGDLMLDAFNKINASTKNLIDHKKYVACTIHRAANLSSYENLKTIINSLNEINKFIPVVMPMHPHTEKKIAEHKLNTAFTILPSIGYPAMKKLIQESKYVITDSGGTSREAYFSQKRSLIIMDKPFWPEIIEAGCSTNSLIEENNMVNDFLKLEKLQGNFDSAIFGNGDAAEKIQEHLSKFL
jgi:UDP-GlcNAc3NAcA epimerase